MSADPPPPEDPHPQPQPHLPWHTTTPPPPSSPTLALWSRKLALHSDELSDLLQRSTSALLTHHTTLETLLTNTHDTLTAASTAASSELQKRCDDLDAQIVAVRRNVAIIPDLLGALEARLEVLDVVKGVVGRVRVLEGAMGEVRAGQRSVLRAVERVERAIGVLCERGLSAEQAQGQEHKEEQKREVVKESRSRKRRRLLDDDNEDEEVQVEVDMDRRGGSPELMSFGARQGRGGGKKRRLMSTFDTVLDSGDGL